MLYVISCAASERTQFLGSVVNVKFCYFVALFEFVI